MSSYSEVSSMERRFAIEGSGGCRSFAIESALQKAAKDVKLVPQQENTASWPVYPSTPEEELEKAKGILAFFKPGQPPLTVGDLSVVKAQRGSPEQVRQRLRTIRDGLSVGDLSVATDMKESLEKEVEARLATKDEELTVGELYRGRRPSDFTPSQSESQRLAAEKIRKDRERREKIFQIKQLLAEESG